ncbi:MAG TPA: hypothetical protein VKB57_07525 [Acidimicrobiales bacterium]|nr:hypothetical protein [Acidimicrobiales bacterium]
MPNTYSLTVINDSEVDEVFAVFALLPESTDFNSLSLAWLTQQIDASNQYVFTWNISWGLAWASMGVTPNYQWAGSGAIAANPTSDEACAFDFTYNNDFQIVPAQGTANGYELWITDSPQIPLPSVKASSVACTLSGTSVCAIDAGPNLTQTFTLHPTYFIDAGNYVAGQMVDGSSVSQFQELQYLDGNTALTATLNQDNTWSVESSSAVDFAARLGGNGGPAPARSPGRSRVRG